MSVDALLDQIGNLTLVQASELVKKMEEKFGISAAAPVAVAAVAGAAPAAGAEEPQTVTVILKAHGDKKVDVIKLVREITGLGLKEAKDLVEAGGKPIKEEISKEEANGIKQKLEAVGAQIEIK